MLLQKNSVVVNKIVIGFIFRKAFTHVVILRYVVEKKTGHTSLPYLASYIFFISIKRLCFLHLLHLHHCHYLAHIIFHAFGTAI